MGTDTISKYAAIDIGSNAVRLLLCNVVEEGNITHYNKAELIRIPLRLGEDAFTIGKITRERTNKLLKTLQAFKLHIAHAQQRHYVLQRMARRSSPGLKRIAV